jgi:hypothetical protein
MTAQTIVEEQVGDPIETWRLVWAAVTISYSARVFTSVFVVVLATSVNPAPAVPPVLGSRNPATPMMKSSGLPVLSLHEGSPEVAVPVHGVLTSGSNGSPVFAPEMPKTTMLIRAAAVAVTVTVPE